MAVIAELPLTLISPLEVQNELESGIAAGHVPVDVSSVCFVPLRAPLSALQRMAAGLKVGELALAVVAVSIFHFE